MVSPAIVRRLQRKAAAKIWITAAAEAQKQTALAGIAEKQRIATIKAQQAIHQQAVEAAQVEAVKTILILAENDRRDRERRKSDRRTPEETDQHVERLDLSNAAKEVPARIWFAKEDISQFNTERARSVNQQPLSGDRRLPQPFTYVGGDIPDNYPQDIRR